MYLWTGEAMIARIMLAAIAAGLFAGLVMTAAQQIKVVPLILQAEQYEGGHAHDHNETQAQSPQSGDVLADAGTSAHTHTGDEAVAEAGSSNMLFGLSRFGGTLLANLVTGAGFGLLLAGVAVLSGVAVSIRAGLLFGAAGWLAVQLLPAIGIPPELPGSPAADLRERQFWWAATVFLSGVGLYLLFLRHEMWALAAGLLAIAAPHIYGTPRPDDLKSAVPAYLAAEYAVAALATTLFFWLVLGAAYGWLASRLEARR
jgi:cobalt transporter subunit CbtA